ncbi:MAG: hypothetical protein KKE96_05880 [Candidatus Altiarchaeota archaeon]|nr:hypothetical protein [Candidatus Altiarchaeota archaeon]MBU4341481.1 hypothetical protein [Candidatus Altiarchaeota archaeon]MBU4436669.1 hypothetical protein [Candidatus Altiarchaeota archaeon]
MRYDELYNKKDIKTFEDIAKLLDKLDKEKWILDELKKEIMGLRRGEVKKEDTHRRARIARHFTENCQLMISKLLRYDRDKKIDRTMNKLIKIQGNGEQILRENPIMQTKPPIDVLKWDSLPNRYALNLKGVKELRKGWGLHTKPLSEMGLSVTMAFMPRNHVQLFHYHPQSEHSLNLGAEIQGDYRDKGFEKTFKIKNEEVAYFEPETIHRLENPNVSINKNISVKSGEAILKWKADYYDEEIREGYGGVLKAHETKKDGNHSVKTHNIKDKHYSYQLEILKIKNGGQVDFLDESALYMYVVDGALKVTTSDKTLRCRENDIIVVDPEIRFTLTSYSKSRIYRVIQQ